ncbi:MAG: tetratricopeptide repeat protein [Acidobacteriota bacterium]|nr:tetratricopeptide repeat protein [Acidobacteriota bacterium]
MKILLIFILLISSSIAVQAQTAKGSFKKATEAAKAGNYQEALALYQKALETIDSNGSPIFLARIHYNLGVCYFHTNQPALAVKEYERAIELSGGTFERAFRALGLAQRELKNWKAAKEAFIKAVRVSNERDGEAWFDLAMVLIEEKDFTSAAEAFKQAIKNKSIALPASHNNLGVILALNGDFAAAEKEFQIALQKSDGKFSEARNNLDFCYQRAMNRELRAKLKFGR